MKDISDLFSFAIIAGAFGGWMLLKLITSIFSNPFKNENEDE